MSGLPKGWTPTTLHDVATWSSGGTPSRSNPAYYSGAIPWFKTGELGPRVLFRSEEYISNEAVAASSAKVFPKGSVAIAMYGATIGKTSIFGIDAATNQACAVGLPEATSAEFLYYFLVSQEKEFVDAGKGGAQPNISQGIVKAWPICLPPANEQTRIVAKLEELLSDLDAGVAELKAAQKKLAQYRQSLLKAAVEGALTAEWRAARSTPLPPRGGGAGGEGAKAPQSTTPIQLQRARALRREQTPSEHGLWQHLRAKRFEAFKFRRQQPLGRYIVDLVCFEKRLIIELDGGQHADQQPYDNERDAWLKSQGFTVLRFWNNAWLAQPEAVLERVWQVLHDTAPPLPNPSPAGGEGLESETGAQLLTRILTERRARWEAKQLAKFKEQGKPAPRDWQKKYPEPVQPDTTDLPQLPEGWVWASVDQLSESVRNGLSKTPNTNQRGFPILKINAVRSMSVNFDAIKHIEIDECEAADYWVEVGDVLATRYNGSVDLLGVFGMVKDVPVRTLHPDKLIRMKPVTGVELGAWMEVCGNVGPSRKHLVSRVKTTAGQTGISGEDLKKTPIPLPPVAEQEITLAVLEERLQALKELELPIEFGLKQSTAQRQNILRAAFSGQLVPQDPNDEPASVLLARIRAERAAREAGGDRKRGRKKVTT